MPNCNFLFFINAYGDLQPTSTPALNNFKWSRELNGVPYVIENSQQIQVTASSTTPNIIPYPFSAIQASPTIGWTFTVSSANATVGATYTDTDSNVWTVLATIAAATTLYASGSGTPPGSGTLTLSSGTGDATITYSATLEPVISESNAINGVASTTGIAVNQLIVGSEFPVGTFVENISGAVITASQNATTSSGSPSLDFYNAASFIYMESDQQVSVIYNGGSPMAITPFEINGITAPGVFFINGPVYSLTVTNPGTVVANIFFVNMGQ
jgi:hypothetical protein